MDLIILASTNVLLAFTVLLLEYIEYVKKRKTTLLRSSELSHTSARSFQDKLRIFVPDSVYKTLEPYLRTKKSVQKEQKMTLIQQVTPKVVITLNLCIAILAFNLQLLTGITWLVWVGLGIGVQGVLYLYLKNQQINTRAVVEKRLPEILDIMARVYRVHSDLRIALQEVAKNSNEPIVKQYFTEMVRLSRFGYTVEESMAFVARKIQSPDLDFVISSIKVNIPVGGEVSKLFEHTARLLRQRKEAKDEIQNLMFQSKFSSIASAAIIPLIILYSFSTNPKYQEVLLFDPTGRLIFFSCLFWWLIGVVIIRKNTRIAL